MPNSTADNDADNESRSRPIIPFMEWVFLQQSEAVSSRNIGLCGGPADHTTPGSDAYIEYHRRRN